MSDMNANQPVDQNTLSSEPPPVSVGGGRNALLPGQRLLPRRVVGTAPDFTVTDQAEFTQQGYIGQGLVDGKGIIARGQYTEDDAYAELAKFAPAERFAFLRQLQALGVYGNSAPSSTGFAGRDLSAMAEALRVANATGYTVDVAMQLIAADPTYKRNAPSRMVRTTPKQDLQAVFKQATGTILGRQLSDAEIDQFVRSYQGREVTEAMGGAAAPSASVAAQQAVEAAAPEEAAAMGALRLAELMDRRIKELA